MKRETKKREEQVNDDDKLLLKDVGAVEGGILR